ncbi:hypothetical protein [Foetidibacter luteolus]|uniref:hypothetical protein n=1 Tax=Foetidibacter luteolus TaxID=2608880 RepID=UPI00129A1530|nr:hypothetical protein [Foetidibacter luteolus]
MKLLYVPLGCLLIAACNNSENKPVTAILGKDSVNSPVKDSGAGQEPAKNVPDSKKQTSKQRTLKRPQLQNLYANKPIHGGDTIMFTAVSNDSLDKQLSADIPASAYFRSYFLKQEPAESFELSLKERKTYITKGGTEITIDAADLVMEDGSPVNGNITITVKEMLRQEDMLKMQAPTTSNGELLESGGSWLIEAKSGERKVNVKNGRSYAISLPDTRYNGYDVFYGNNALDSAIDWSLSEGKNEFSIGVYSMSGVGITGHLFKRHSFSSDDRTDALSASFVNQAWIITPTTIQKYSIRKKKLLIQGKERMFAEERYKSSEIYLAEMEKKDIDFLERFSRQCSVVEYIRDNRFASNTGYILENEWQGKFYQVVIDSTLLAGTSRLFPDGLRKSFSKRVEGFIKAAIMASGQPASLVNNKPVAYVTTFGWINCDRFYKSPGPKMNYYAKLSTPSKLSALQPFLLFRNIKSLLSGTTSKGRLLFSKIPKGNEVKCIVLARANDKTLVGATDYFKLGSPDEPAMVTLQEKTDAEIKKLLNEL